MGGRLYGELLLYFVASRWVACSRAKLRRGIINPKTVKKERKKIDHAPSQKKKKKGKIWCRREADPTASTRHRPR
jgi:hypothetical protein